MKRLLLSLAVACGTSLRATPVLESTGAPNQDEATARPAGSMLVSRPTDSASAPFYQWGKFGFRPNLGFSRVYASGLPTAPGKFGTTFIDTVFAGLRIDAGDNWHVDYLPSWIDYSRRDYRDSLSQQLTVTGTALGQRSAWAFNQQYSESDAPSLETATQTHEQSSITTLSGMFSIAQNVTAGAMIDQRLTFMDKFADSMQWSISPALSYQPSQGISIGSQLTSGYIFVYHGSDVRFDRPTATASWQASSKVNFAASVGYERWNFIAPRRGHVAGPFYDVTLTHKPFEFTALALSLQRANTVTPFQNQAGLSEAWKGKITQRLLGRFWAILGASYEQKRYTIPGFAGTTTVRKDNVHGYQAALRTTFLRHASATVFYEYKKDVSSVGIFRVSTSQYGLRFAYSY